MKYISGTSALNIPCELNTTGDWHRSCINWEKVKLWDSSESIFGEYGIECDKYIPELDAKRNVANHIRACLDLIEKGNFPGAQGMYQDYLDGDDNFNNEIFKKVFLLKEKENWNDIYNFMCKEYRTKWLNFIEGETKEYKI